MNTQRFKRHPLSAIFPSFADDELQSLADDIKSNGLKESIVLYQNTNEVLDGWHRYLACEIAGVNPRTISFKGVDPKSFVKSANWHRRHMTTSQRALAVVALNEWHPPGRSNAKGEPGSPLKTVAEMAAEVGTTERTIQQAKNVESNGSAVLKQAVHEGDISVKRAAEVAKLPKAKQAKALAAPKKKTKPAKTDDWKAKHDALAADYDELKENRDELADELKTCEAIRVGTVALEMKRLREHLKICTRRRDELMAGAVEMRKSLKWWEAQAKKLGYKRAEK